MNWLKRLFGLDLQNDKNISNEKKVEKTSHSEGITNDPKTFKSNIMVAGKIDIDALTGYNEVIMNLIISTKEIEKVNQLGLRSEVLAIARCFATQTIEFTLDQLITGKEAVDKYNNPKMNALLFESRVDAMKFIQDMDNRIKRINNLINESVNKVDSEQNKPGNEKSQEKKEEKTIILTDQEIFSKAWSRMMMTDNNREGASILNQSKNPLLQELAEEYKASKDQFQFRLKMEKIMRERFGMTRW